MAQHVQFFLNGLDQLTRIYRLRFWFACFLYGISVLLVISSAAEGGEFPLWEAGAGLATINLADYRGSDERTIYWLPVPYLVYRGEILKVDRKSTRGILFQTDRIELNISVNASPPVNSNKNSAREGMPDLDPTGEIGPSLYIDLRSVPFFSGDLSLQFPIRMVAATDLTYLRQVGYVFNPRINVEWALGTPEKRWNAGLTTGPLFTDKKFNAYYYGVDPAFETFNRPRYAVRGGYGGFQLTAALSRRFASSWFGAFARLDDLHGAVFENSPLVRSRYSVMFGLALSWVVGVSDQKVSAEE